MASIDKIRASDGSENASVATVQNSRSPGSSTIVVDTVAGIPDFFTGTMGTPHTFTDPITSETITVISEATAVDFAGHVDGSNLEIDDIAPGYSDLGSEVGDIIVIRPTTQWGDNLAEVLEVAHEDDGALKDTAIFDALDAKGVLGATHIYTAGDTWNKPDNLKFVVVELVGGGGGSGGCGTTGASQHSPGGGGGGGEYAMKKILAADLAATVTVSVGAGGAAASAGANSGGTGGTSSFGAHVTAIGGGGGGSNNATGNIGQGANGGSGGGGGTGGDLHIVGGDGGPSNTFSDYRGVGGFGGASRFGGGVRGGQNTSTSSGVAGNAGRAYGGGASGGHNSASTTQRAGLVGGAGLVIVREYF